MAAPNTESEQVNYIRGGHRSSRNRLARRTIEDGGLFLLPYLAKLPSDFTLLDLGCGPGSITIDLAKRYPAATFVGIDSDAACIEKAKALAGEEQAGNVSFAHGDILKLDESHAAGFRWGGFDVVYTNQVLVHMQKPVDGLQVMKRAAKSHGGIVASRAIFGSGTHVFPASDTAREGFKTWYDIMARNGSDPETGGNLIRYAMQAGWTRDQITFSSSVNITATRDEKEKVAESLVDSLLDPASGARKKYLQLGLADEAGLEKQAQSWREWVVDDHSWAGWTSGEIVCRNEP